MTFTRTARRAAHAAAAILHWRPPEFWAATPAELVTALGIDAEAAPATADAPTLARLMEAFPDAR